MFRVPPEDEMIKQLDKNKVVSVGGWRILRKFGADGFRVKFRDGTIAREFVCFSEARRFCLDNKS